MSSGKCWYVVHTQPHNETRADVNLRRQGYATYLPRYQRNRRHARRTEAVIRPLFPRYLFVMLDVARDQWRAIQSTFGVSHLLVAGDEPLAVPAGVVDEIMARESSNGLVKLGLPQGISIGSRVRLIDGLFAETEGVVERIADNQRVAVLLQLLGRQVRVHVPAANIGMA